MPMITLQISSPEVERLAEQAAQLAASLTARILRKPPEVTHVAVHVVPPERWFVAGRSLAAWGKAGFFLEVRISDGTNTKDDKAAFVAEAFQAMGKLLGELHPESYVHVIDARADAYGYGGLTQERRYIEARKR
jgi:4-oxalocrotonate tautomerase